METPWDFHKRTSAFLPWLLTDRPLHSVLPTAQHPVKWQEGQQTERREACVSPAQNRFTLEACPWSSGSEVYWCFSWVLITPRKCGLRAKKKSLDLGDRDWVLAISSGTLGSGHYLLVSAGFVISQKQVSQWVLPGSAEALGQIFRGCFWPEMTLGTFLKLLLVDQRHMGSRGIIVKRKVYRLDWVHARRNGGPKGLCLGNHLPLC